MSVRHSLISQHVAIENARILEIGALNSPTYRRPTFNVSYVDYASREELAKKGISNPRYQLDGLVDVDFVVSGVRYSEVITQKFDLVVANHVIEHIVDPIAWLQDLGSLLDEGGCVFLSVPDRRYTFDLLRREATITDLLRAHFNRQVKPDFFNLLDHFWYTRPVKAADVWQQRHHDLLKQRRFTSEQALANAAKHAKEPYADVHCYAYTQESFKGLLEDLDEFSLIGFQELKVFPTVTGSNEFHVVLGGFNPTKGHRIGMTL